MTAIRNFPHAPLAQRPRQPLGTNVPAWAIAFWQGLQRVGRQRAAWELEAMAGRRAQVDPEMAQQLRAAAADCRRAVNNPTSTS